MSELENLFMVDDTEIRKEEGRVLTYYHFGDDIQKHSTTTTTVFVRGVEDVFDDALEALYDNGKGNINDFLDYANSIGLETLEHKWKDFPSELCEIKWDYDELNKYRWCWCGLYYLGCDALEAHDNKILDFVVEGLKIIGCDRLSVVFGRLREDINGCDEYGNTSLIFAATNEADTMAKALIAAGADVNLKNPRGKTALMCAIENINENIASLLIEKGADVDLQDNEGKTALIYAVEGNNHCDFVKKLINAKVKMNMYDSNGKTALMYAVESGQHYVVKKLIEGKADPNLGVVGNVWREGVLPINVARSNNDIKMVEILSERTEEKCKLKAKVIPDNGHGRTLFPYVRRR